MLPTQFVPRPWQALVEPEKGRVDCAAYTMCTLEELRDGLRRRDVYVTPSERFADARSSLLSDTAWDASREDTCRALSLPIEPDAFIDQLAEDLDDAYERTREGLTDEHAIHALAARGELPVDRLDALPEPPSLMTLRANVDALMPPADLPDLVFEIAAKTEFLRAFTNDHEPNAQLHDLDVSLCAVLVAQACNVGYRPLVEDDNPALREARLRYVAQRHLRADTLAAANARIVDYHTKLPLAERWGGGEVASIDGLRFVVPRRTIHAGYNRRYFDRRRGVTALGTTADHYAGLRTIVIPGTQPDAPYALDALLDPQTSVRPREIMTDTAGYSVMWTPGCFSTAKAGAGGDAAGRVRGLRGATISSVGAVMLTEVGGGRYVLCEFGLRMRLAASPSSWSMSLAPRSPSYRRSCVISPRGAVRRTGSRRTRMTCATCGASSPPTDLPVTSATAAVASCASPTARARKNRSMRSA